MGWGLGDTLELVGLVLYGRPAAEEEEGRRRGKKKRRKDRGGGGGASTCLQIRCHVLFLLRPGLQTTRARGRWSAITPWLFGRASIGAVTGSPISFPISQRNQSIWTTTSSSLHGVLCGLGFSVLFFSLSFLSFLSKNILLDVLGCLCMYCPPSLGI